MAVGIEYRLPRGSRRLHVAAGVWPRPYSERNTIGHGHTAANLNAGSNFDGHS